MTRLDEKRIQALEAWVGAARGEFVSISDVALQFTELHELLAGYQRTEQAERERDEWKAKFEMVRESESSALAENDALTFIANTNGFQRDKAERERDALRKVLRLIAEREPICDYDWAPCDAARAALAQWCDYDGYGSCPTCYGSGRVLIEQHVTDDGLLRREHYGPCPVCGGAK